MESITSTPSITLIRAVFDATLLRDLYHLVKFLPAYALPAGMPSSADLAQNEAQSVLSKTSSIARSRTRPSDAEKPSLAPQSSILYQRGGNSVSAPHLPLPATAASPKKASFLEPPIMEELHMQIPRRGAANRSAPGEVDKDKVVLPRADEYLLMPAHMPPKYHVFDLFPFSLLVQFLTERGNDSLKGKKAARLRAKIRNRAISHNLPLEISLYLVCGVLRPVMSR